MGCALMTVHAEGQEKNKRIPSANLTITSVTTGGTSDFRITGQMIDLDGIYTPDSIIIDDVVMDNKCDVYKVSLIVDQYPVMILDLEGIDIRTPNNGPGIIFQPTKNLKLPLITNGIPERLKACILNHQIIALDETSMGGGVIVSQGIYRNDSDAGVNGVAIGEYYTAHPENTMGEKPGNLVIREF